MVYRFFERELELENARSVEFQRVHRLGKSKAGQSRPIIVRFFRFPERELVFRNVRVLGVESEVKVYVDLPKEILERRQKLWPKMNKDREEGKVAFLISENQISLIFKNYLAICLFL